MILVTSTVSIKNISNQHNHLPQFILILKGVSTIERRGPIIAAHLWYLSYMVRP